MKYTVRQVLTLLAALIVVACAATPGKVSQTRSVDELNLRQGMALRGYDPVAYYTDQAAVAGDPAVSYQWQGATWLFSSAGHRDAFKADPARYAPQFGGYCAFAVSRGTTADADPHQWAIVDGKLYVNNNAFAKKLWDQDRPGNIVAGDTNWPLIPKQPLVTGERSPKASQTMPSEASR